MNNLRKRYTELAKVNAKVNKYKIAHDCHFNTTLIGSYILICFTDIEFMNEYITSYARCPDTRDCFNNEISAHTLGLSECIIQHLGAGDDST